MSLAIDNAGTQPGTGPAAVKKPRSCVTCRSRKVRCDKKSPCSNCVKGGIECVLPSLDRPPRWARRLVTAAKAKENAADPNTADPDAESVMERLRSLEELVKDLSGKLEKANAVVAAAAGVSPGSSRFERDSTSPGSSTVSDVQRQMGRLVVGQGESRYVSSDFWTRINDELDGLNMDTQVVGMGEYDSSDEDDLPTTAPSTHELDRQPLDRNGLLFRSTMNEAVIDTRTLHPLPSQIPFLLDIFSENVNSKAQVIHMPTLRKMIRNLPGGDLKQLTPVNEALMFAVYYAAVTSMEDDSILTNFGTTKPELNLKYRVGLEHALAKADFLSTPDITLVQALIIFLFLARRHDSPNYVWMMVGLVIRMAIALGLQRDGSQFKNLSPFDVEMRRRIWSALVMLDLRSSEDQGVDFTIKDGSFDTRPPSNLNDEDIYECMTETPVEREGVTDTTPALVWCNMSGVTKEVFMLGADPQTTVDDQFSLLNKFYDSLDSSYSKSGAPAGDLNYWLTLNITQLVVSKMTLIIYLPLLFATPTANFPKNIQMRLFTAAIEVIEYNHALNSTTAYRPWRWIFQTCTHWHAIIFLLLSMTRHPWSALSERAWVALHSTWLFPAQSAAKKDHSVWIPLKTLMGTARRYRSAELERLKQNPIAASQLEAMDREIMQPKSDGPFPGQDNVEVFRQRWRQLLSMPPKNVGVQSQVGTDVVDSLTIDDVSWDMVVDPSIPQTAVPTGWLDPTATGVDFSTWLWNAGDAAGDVEGMNSDHSASVSAGDGVDWGSWLETAKYMEVQSG